MFQVTSQLPHHLMAYAEVMRATLYLSCLNTIVQYYKQKYIHNVVQTVTAETHTWINKTAVRCFLAISIVA